MIEEHELYVPPVAVAGIKAMMQEIANMHWGDPTETDVRIIYVYATNEIRIESYNPKAGYASVYGAV